MFFDDLRARQKAERAATDSGTRDGDVTYDYDAGVYRANDEAPMGQRSTDYQSGSFALSNVGDRVASGDVDGDGHSDLFVRSAESGSGYVLPSRGNGTKSSSRTSGIVNGMKW